MPNKINYQKILVPIDGSAKSINAFEYALKFASAYINCEVHMLYVIDKENIEQVQSYQEESYGTLSKRYEQQGKNYLNKAMQKAKKVNYNRSLIKKKILEGNPVEKITEFAEDFDLIIMAARGKKHVINIMMGHVTERVINITEIPVLIIP